MRLKLTRFQPSKTSTIGRLTVPGLTCFTLEDPVREVPGEPVESWKVQDKTAIPRGVYQIILDFSQRFQRELPRLLEVPGFRGIRIHAGNTAKDTSGCILVGSSYSDNWVSNSRVTFNKLFAILEAAYDRGEDISIEVT